MKKFFGVLLFLFYFFVIQILIAGYLWEQIMFYRLAIVNFIALLFLSVFYYALNFRKVYSSGKNAVSKKSVRNTSHHNGKSSIDEKAKSKINIGNILKKYVFVLVLFVLILLSLSQLLWVFLPFGLGWVLLVYLFLFLLFAKPLFQKKISFGKKLFLPKDFFFWTSILIVFLVYSLISFSSFVPVFEIFLSVLAGFLFFIFYILVFKTIGQYSVWRLLVSKLYLLILILTLLFSIPQFYFQIKDSQMINSSSQGREFAWQSFVESVGEIKNNILGKENVILDEVPSIELQSGELSTGVGTVISNSVKKTLSGDADLSVMSGDILIENEDMIDGVLFVPGLMLRNAENYTESDALRYDDVLIYLIEFNDISLSVETNVKFTYMSFDNKDYSYFKTAFQNKLIGKDLKPSALVKCDNYLVMKGILEGWDVDTYVGNIFQQYYKAAKDLDKLNACELGAFLMKGNL